MMMTRSHIIRIFSLVLVLSGITAFMGNACSSFKQHAPQTYQAFSCAASNDIVVKATTKTASVAYGGQVLDTMVACTGLRNISELTRKTYDDRRGGFSDYGNVRDVTGPMLMGLSSVAIEVCNDLVTEELDPTVTKQKRFFDDFHLSDSTTPDIDRTFKRFARACWGRNPDPEELQLVSTTAASLSSLSKRELAIAVCTSALASLDSYKM